MRFLIDICASSHRMRNALIDQGHDVVSALEIDPRATDETLLATALEEQRTIITEDKDFGELIFVHRLDHPCIIRFMEIPVEDLRDIAEQTMEDGAGRNNPMPINSVEQVLEVLEKAW